MDKPTNKVYAFFFLGKESLCIPFSNHKALKNEDYNHQIIFYIEPKRLFIVPAALSSVWYKKWCTLYSKV